jgi:hypothetical protein
MSRAEYQSVKPGVHYKKFLARYGKPDPSQTQRISTKGQNDVTVYYNVEGGGVMDSFQFDFVNGRLDSKAKF